MNTPRRLALLASVVVVGLGLAGCRRAPSHPGDPLLDAIRAGERGSGNLTYAESQGKTLFGQYCATCHGDEGRGDGQNASNLTPPRAWRPRERYATWRSALPNHRIRT